MPMKILLDTNIVIHREASHIINEDVGVLFNWIDRLHLTKCIHPITFNEIMRHSDKQTVETMRIKLEAYYILKTAAPLDARIKEIIQTVDKDPNDENDSMILNELVCNRVDLLITEDRAIHKKADLLSVHDRVFTIDSFLEKTAAENPQLVDYNVLSIKRELFGKIYLNDSFFDSFRDDYINFNKWFNSKSDEHAYICKSQDHIIAFLYLKLEDVNENYSDITPNFSRKKRLKIGTFKVSLNPFKLGERFIKIIFDNALVLRVDEIYVTVFPKRTGQLQLIELLKDWGFYKYGIKITPSGSEEVFVRNFTKKFDPINPKLTYPYFPLNSRSFIVPIHEQYHTELFPDSILRTESPIEFIENKPHRNAIRKSYISRSIERDLRLGDLIVFYRTGGYYKSVVSTIGMVENVITSIKDATDFIRLCRKRSIFSDRELNEWWDRNCSNRPFIVNFLYLFSFRKRPNLKRLIELGVIRDFESAPRGFTPITNEHFKLILKEAQFDESSIVN
jgi:predicted nucleic acid-binding protein